MAKGATDMALAYAMERKTFGKSIAEHQAIQLKLAEMSTRAAAAALLVEQAAVNSTAGSAATWKRGRQSFRLRSGGTEQPRRHACLRRLQLFTRL